MAMSSSINDCTLQWKLSLKVDKLTDEKGKQSMLWIDTIIIIMSYTTKFAKQLTTLNARNNLLYQVDS